MNSIQEVASKIETVGGYAPPLSSTIKPKKVLVINGHPDPLSFNRALSEAYVKGASTMDNNIEVLNIGELAFNPNLAFGYREKTELEPDLLKAIDLIKSADHLVWVFPMWWYGYPALMKGFIDRTFLPGVFFKYQKGKAFPEKLLKGKTGRIIITADTVRWYDHWFMHSPAIQQFKKGTLEFCGVSPVKVSYFAVIKDSTPAQREKWLQKAETLGSKVI
ncbi:MAG: NAD(P)H-dependent oxidoreductase [Bacteroidota bacterium]